jgi:hypothetical protein
MGFKLKLPNLSPKNVGLGTLAPFYALGAGLNQLTGGKTTTYNIYKAASGKAPAPTFSLATQALSGYSSATPKQGQYGIPLVNRGTTKLVGKVAATTIHDVVAPAADAAAKGLFGVSLKTVAWTAAGAVVGLGGVYVATR